MGRHTSGDDTESQGSGRPDTGSHRLPEVDPRGPGQSGYAGPGRAVRSSDGPANQPVSDRAESTSRRTTSGPLVADQKPGDDTFGFDHRDTGSSRRAGILWGLLALLVVAALVTGLVLWRSGVVGGCGDRTQVSVASDQTMTGSLKALAQKASDNSCYDFTVSTLAGADAPGLLTQGDKAPDLWVADSQTQARRVTTQVRRNLDLVNESTAKSPVVVVGKQVPALASWTDVMKLPDLRMGSPIDTSTGDAPIIGALAEVNAGTLQQKQLTDAMTVLAVQQNNARLANDNEGTRLNLANTSNVPVVTTEQQFLLFARTHPGSELKQKAPSDGTVMLDYPMVNTASSARHDDAAAAGKVLSDTINGGDGQSILHEAGYRGADGAALPGNSGLGNVELLNLKDPTQVDKALRQWQVLGVPIRTLVVEDTSGSMEQSAGSGDGTRADLLLQASLTGLKLFPNNTQIGGWAFSIDKGGSGQDWQELAPIRRLDAPASGGKTHRDYLGDAVRRGLSDLGGGTGLYDTTLAAFKKVQDSYDPNYSNSVIIMTDGENEDPNSISLDTLLSELKRLEDPARPVLILTIGISDDADTDSLKQIADTTGGTSYVAKSADDIKTVFVDAIAARVAAAGR
ncbi:substrate-binding domain-containing protein [Gordonia sp. CPCC 205333]|uniref:substrate-binding domain-containing protein n=1 Tax=Gordonia sp. CPCC 205333 TaxID=3140790 RepID=UPI003AF37FCE